jgi:hypothetical protein
MFACTGKLQVLVMAISMRGHIAWYVTVPVRLGYIKPSRYSHIVIPYTFDSQGWESK